MSDLAVTSPEPGVPPALEAQRAPGPIDFPTALAPHTEKVLEANLGGSHRGPMAITILSSREREAMRRAGRAARATLDGVAARIEGFRTTGEIAAFVAEDTRARGGRPSQLGFHGFPAVCCTSRNEVVCHGIPSQRELLEPGDIVNVDVTTELGGFHGDTSRTFFVGAPSPAARHLVRVAEEARDVGVRALRVGRRLGEVGQVIEEFVRAEGCSVVRELGGHGIGRAMHLEPHVPHHGFAGGARLREGMALTIEPMINLGLPEVELLEDGWTIVTRDRSLSAQFEHTVLITHEGPEVLT
jgi:methionyl aminopeptidase